MCVVVRHVVNQHYCYEYRSARVSHGLR